VSSTTTPPSTSANEPDLGPGASLHGKQVFPPDNPWNQDISKVPVDPNSARLIAAIGANDRLHPDFGTVYRGAPERNSLHRGEWNSAVGAGQSHSLCE
jgi:hypothetical protein